MSKAPNDLMPVYAMQERSGVASDAINALRQIGEIAVPPNATAAEIMAVVREMQAIAAKGLGK